MQFNQFKLNGSRRRLLIWTGGAISSLTAILGSKTSKVDAQTKPMASPSAPPKPMASPSPGKAFRPVVGPASLLDKNGKVLTDKVLIVRNTATKKLVAVAPACTHKGCIMDWNQSKQRFVCPCHGAEFDAMGKVQQGPAQTNLTTYEVKVENNAYQIK